jgi:hypothetical protein
MAEWLCTQERWNPEGAIIFYTAACYRRALVGKIRDDAHPDNSAPHAGRACLLTGLVGNLVFISLSSNRQIYVFKPLKYLPDNCTRHQCPCALRFLTFFANGELKLD